MILTFLSRVCMSMYNYIREHVEENNQQRGVGGYPPDAKKCKFVLKTNAQNVLKQKNMQKYFVQFLQGYLLKLGHFPIIFLKK